MIDRNSIRRALAPLHASEDTIEEVLKMAKQENTKRRYYPAHRVIAVAAVVAVMVAALCGVAYAANWFGIQDVLLGHTVVDKDWDEEGNYGFMEMEMETISMQGLSDTPEYKAYQEFRAFYDDYMLNDWETDEPGEDNEQTEALKTVYGYCFNNTLAAKIQEVCEKYDLRARSAVYESMDLAQLSEVIGVEGIYEGEGYPFTPEYRVYDDGSFMLQNDWFPEGDEEDPDAACPFILERNVKGYYSEGSFIYEPGQTPVEWSYTTARGDDVSMVLVGSQGYVMHDGSAAFVSAWVMSRSGEDITAEELERFADTVYFGELGEAGAVTWPTEPSSIYYEPEVVYDATPAEYEALAVGDSFTAESMHSEGSFEYTVNRVRMVSDLTEVGLTAREVLERVDSVYIYGEDGERWLETEEIASEDGKLAENIRFILVDVTAKNIDAASRLEGWAEGPLEHEYIFRAAYELHLEDVKVYDKKEGVTFDSTDEGCIQTDWYSGQYERADAWDAIEILPGESVTYQLGFLVGNAEDNFDGLYLATYGPDPAVVKLELE